MLARIPPNHKTITLCIAVLFLWFNWDGFCPLFKPILCVLCIWLSCISQVSSLKYYISCALMIFLFFHPVLSCLIKVDIRNSHWYNCYISRTMHNKLDCTVGEIGRPYRHHGALYDDIFKTNLFEFSPASHYNISPVNIRKSVKFRCFWSVKFLESLKCRCF